VRGSELSSDFSRSPALLVASTLKVKVCLYSKITLVLDDTVLKSGSAVPLKLAAFSRKGSFATVVKFLIMIGLYI